MENLQNNNKELQKENQKKKVYHVQVNISIDGKYYCYSNYKSYRTAKQALDAIKAFRKHGVSTHLECPWKWRIKIFKIKI